MDSGGMEMLTIALLAKEQDFLAAQKFIREEICRIFGVPACFWETRKQYLRQLRELIEELTTNDS